MDFPCLEWLQGHIAFQEHPWRCSRFDPNQADPQKLDSWWAEKFQIHDGSNAERRSKTQHVSLTFCFRVFSLKRDSCKKGCVSAFKFIESIMEVWKYKISNWRYIDFLAGNPAVGTCFKACLLNTLWELGVRTADHRRWDLEACVWNNSAMIMTNIRIVFVSRTSKSWNWRDAPPKKLTYITKYQALWGSNVGNQNQREKIDSLKLWRGEGCWNLCCTFRFETHPCREYTINWTWLKCSSQNTWR